MIGYPLNSSSVQTSGGGALSAPTDPNAGIPLAAAVAARVVVSADSSQTLTGTGNMRGYVYCPTLSRWAAAPYLDFPITPSGGTWTAQRDMVSTQFDLGVQQGRVTWVPDTVAVSSGHVNTVIEGMTGQAI